MSGRSPLASEILPGWMIASWMIVSPGSHRKGRSHRKDRRSAWEVQPPLGIAIVTAFGRLSRPFAIVTAMRQRVAPSSVSVLIRMRGVTNGGVPDGGVSGLG